MMDKENANHGSGRYSCSSLPKSSYNMDADFAGSSNFLPFSSPFSPDISQMSDSLSKDMGQRSHHSDILRLPEDISFDRDLGVVGGFEGPPFSNETEEDLCMYLDVDEFITTTSASSDFQVGESSNKSYDNVPRDLSEKQRFRHQHSQSMDESTTIQPEMVMSGSDDPATAKSKKALSDAKLAELAIIDPKRAKRIRDNRQSAAKSKEKKMRYTSEIEGKARTSTLKVATLKAQLSILKRDAGRLEATNSELKLQWQPVEQKIRLYDAVNNAMKEEIKQLKAVLITQQLKQQRQFWEHQLHQFQQQEQELQTRGSVPPPSVQNEHAPTGSE